MSFWQWFQANGAKLFAFIAAVALALHGMPWMSAGAIHAMEIAGVLATIAHQIFFPGTPSFPNQPGPTAPKA